MIQLLKADFYRLWKSRSARICMVLNILIAIITILGTSLFTKLFIVAGETFEGMSGISTLTQSMSWSSIIAIFCTIAITLYTTSGFSNNTQKYPVTKGYGRIEVYLSGLIITSAFAVMMLLAYVLSSTLMATLILGFGTFTLDMLSGSIMVIGIQALLHIALASLMYMVAMTLKGIGEAIACNLLILTLFASIVCNLINRFAENFDSNLYWILNNMMFLTNPMPSMVDISRAVLVSAGFLMFSTFLGLFTFHKYEFK